MFSPGPVCFNTCNEIKLFQISCCSVFVVYLYCRLVVVRNNNDDKTLLLDDDIHLLLYVSLLVNQWLNAAESSMCV